MRLSSYGRFRYTIPFAKRADIYLLTYCHVTYHYHCILIIIAEQLHCTPTTPAIRYVLLVF